jgi:WhiB family redox-sensing transcriptional regulator
MTPTWRDEAACVTESPEIFFPHPTDGDSRVKRAKKVCDRCPVKDDCLAEAIANPNLQGVWGGTTHAERTSHLRKIHRKRSLNRRHSSL